MSYVTQKVSKKDVRNHLTEISPFRWVIAACQCYKFFDHGRLVATLYHKRFLSYPAP